jgi:beta-lactamase superfamily II metal-dependent hydrolase
MKRFLIIIISILLLLGCSCGQGASERAHTLEIYAFSVGKADALLIKAPDAAIMIDTGENGDGVELVLRLEQLGVEKLDLLILTHYDKDHIGGADTIIRNVPIDRVILPDYEKDSKQYTQLLDALKRSSAEITYMAQDLSLKYGELDVSIWVSPVPFDGTSDNDQSLITKLLFDGKAYLFMGDAEEAELNKLIYSERNLTCDVLKLPHHGVYDEQLFALMTTSLPSYVIICDSQKNPADAQTLEAIGFYGPIVLQTKNGEVHLTVVNGIIKSE